LIAGIAALGGLGIGDTPISVWTEDIRDKRMVVIHVVGLPRRQFSQKLRHAHRSPAGDGIIKTARCLGRNRSRGTEGKTYAPRITHRSSSTSTAPAVHSTPAGPRRIHELRRACPARRHSSPDRYARAPGRMALGNQLFTFSFQWWFCMEHLLFRNLIVHVPQNQKRFMIESI